MESISPSLPCPIREGIVAKPRDYGITIQLEAIWIDKIIWPTQIKIARLKKSLYTRKVHQI